MKRPSYDELLLAAEWLDNNEGDGGEMYTCKAVAKWLREVADDAVIRSEAKQDIHAIVRAAVDGERERCAKIAEAADREQFALHTYQGVEIAAAIRKSKSE